MNRPGVVGLLFKGGWGPWGTYSLLVRDRAVRLVFEQTEARHRVGRHLVDRSKVGTATLAGGVDCTELVGAPLRAPGAGE